MLGKLEVFLEGKWSLFMSRGLCLGSGFCLLKFLFNLPLGFTESGRLCP